MNTSPETTARNYLPHFVRSRNRALTLARSLWIFLAAALLAMIVYSIGVNTAWISPSLPAAELATLQQVGIQPSDYAILRMVLELIVVLSFTTSAFVLFWSKRDDGMALLVATALLTFGATVFPIIAIPSLQGLIRLVQVIGIATAGLTIFLFPNGRFFPAWTRPLALFLGVWLTALLVFPEVTTTIGSLEWLNPVHSAVQLVAWLLGTDVTAEAFAQIVQSVRTIGFVSMLIGGFGAGAAAQIYRYLHTSDPAERQQTKLVVFSLAVAVFSSLLYYLPPVFLAPLRETGSARLIFQTAGQLVFSTTLVLVPMFLMVAVLRYRLWDVDVLINRTIVYGLLTGLLAAVYFISIYFFQALVQAVTGQGSDWVLVGSTLIIAALFRPLRDRVQIFIDRRFYREKVDFRRAFTEFGRALRTLIELPELQRTLVDRVAELLHIRYAAIYLRGAGNRFPPAYSLRIPPESNADLILDPEDLRRLGTGGIVARPVALPFPLLVPLTAPQPGSNVPVGILALGPRLSGEGYSHEDQSLLLGLAEQAGTSIRVAQLIDEKQTETRQRMEAEKQLADHRNSPLGRAEATADRILSRPDLALLEFHRLVQASEHDPEAAALVANLSSALKSAGADELARLAGGYGYLLEDRVSAEMLPGALRIILAALDPLMRSTQPLFGGAAAQAAYSAGRDALAAGSVSDIAGWKSATGLPQKTQNQSTSEGKEFLASLAGMLNELGGISESLQAYERVDTARDKLAYLAGAVESLRKLDGAARAGLGCADRPIICGVAAHWTGIVKAAMGELQSRAQIVCEFLTRHLWQADEITVVLSLRNAGHGFAQHLEVRPMPSTEYTSLEDAPDIPGLGPGEETQVELRLRPSLAPGVRRFRLLFEIRYADPRGENQCESFADSIQLLEPSGEFTRIPNPYVVGIPLKAGSPMFFGREDVMEFLLEQLAAAHRNNLVLIGPRRTGKSSLLKQLPLRLGDDFLPVYLDGQALALDPGLPAFLHAVATEISLALGERGWKVPPPDLAAFAENPTALFERSFLSSVRLCLGGCHLLLLLDEFEELESAARRGSLDASIFSFLRHLIQHVENLSVIFCGTHRLEELASDYWSVLFNISLYRHIGFLSREEAVRLIQEPVAEYGMGCDDLALEKIWRVTAGHPYFLQLICHSLVNRHNRQRRNYVTVADVNASVDEILTTGEAHFVYLWMDSTREQKLALFAMSRLSGAGSLAPGQAAEELKRQGITVDADALGGAFRDLAARDIFTAFQRPEPPFGEAYAWKLGLLGLWVEKSRSLDRILAEEKGRG
jgi:GAF domain-containing protein